MAETTAQRTNAAASQHAVSQARAAVLGGRGPGASRAEVVSQTRGRVVQAGLPVIRRLAQTAHDTARARGELSTFIDGGLVPTLARQPGAAATEADIGLQRPESAAGNVRAPDTRWVRDTVLTTCLLMLVARRRSQKQGNPR